jgi:polar amino acid transport system substrate-binding protein
MKITMLAVPLSRTVVALAVLALCLVPVARAADDLAARVPEKLRQAGKLIVGTSPTYPPLEFKDPTTLELKGLDIDLAVEIGRRLGLKTEWREQSFDQLINSLDTGRIDMGASGITDIPERREKADYVDYFATGTQLFTLREQAAGLNKPEDVCGKPVAVNRNGIFFIRMRAFSEQRCVAKGLPEIRFSLTDKTADARLQLIQGRVVAAAQGVDAIRYLNEQANSPDRGKFVLIGEPIAIDVAGFGFAKQNGALRDAVADALDTMMQDGTYAAIFTKWELPYAKMSAVTINAAPRKH